LKVVGIVFSSRDDGNCTNCTKYCLEIMEQHGYKSELINVFHYDVQGCGVCNYKCFNNGICAKNDDVNELYRRCFEADKIIFAIPTFSGHLASSYFTFWERSQGVFKDNDQYEKDFLKKINIIVIGNITSGGDMALHEALYSFTNRSFYPETILLSSREYDRSSIKGDLMESTEVRNRLEGFAKKCSVLEKH